MSNTPSARAQIITRRTYNRPLDEDGTVFETWAQTVDRVIRHQKWLWERAQKRAITFAQGEELEELRELLMERKGLMAGRTLWLGGTDIAKRRMASQLNCSFKRVATVHDVVDIFWLLLQGAGTGFEAVPGTLNGFSRKLGVQIVRSTRTLEQWAAGERGDPMNHEFINGDTWTIRVGDSAEAWAKAVGKIMAGKAAVKTLVLDLSAIRASGVRLKGYGWVSSGDGPLSKALEGICSVMNRRAGKLLNRIDLLDVLNWLGTTLSSRRSAQIALCPAHDAEADQFASAKKDYWTTGNIQRGQSNNSLVFWHKPSKHELRGIFQAMIDAGGSEPGFINGAAAQKRAPWFAGVNPCFSADTLIVTRHGAKPIADLVGQEAEVWDGQTWVSIDNFRVTGENQPMLKIEMHDGAEMRVTPMHTMLLEDGRKVPAHTLVAGDVLRLSDITYDGGIEEKGAYLKGFLLGDGTHTESTRPVLWLYEPKFGCQQRLIASGEEVEAGVCFTNAKSALAFVEVGGATHRLQMQGIACRKGELLPWATEYKRRLPADVYSWDRRSKTELIAGLFDADGCALDTSHGFAYQLASTQRAFLQDVQTLLKSIGVRAHLGKVRDGGLQAMPGGSYQCDTVWRLSIAQAAAIVLSKQVSFARLTSFADRTTVYRGSSRAGKIKNIVFDGVDEKVYCCTVPGSNNVSLSIGITTGQCAEQLLGDGGVCNLSEIVLPKFNGDWYGLLRAARVIARANYRQTCIDMRDGVLQHTWHELNEFLHLCGVGVTGVVQWEHASTKSAWFVLADTVRFAAHEMADELGLPHPKHVTTVKPSGTLSKIADVSEGVHAPLGRFIFNNVSFGLHDPLIPHLKAAGYFMQLNPLDPSSMLVRLPTEYPGAPLANTESAIDQLERYKLLMENYVDSNCSVTISYDPSEAKAIVDWLHANWDTYVGVSFIYRNDPTKTAADLGYAYLPQEVVTEEVFRAYADSLLPIDVENLGGGDLVDEGCASGACPIR